jgi:hypothetical protein
MNFMALIIKKTIKKIIGYGYKINIIEEDKIKRIIKAVSKDLNLTRWV